MTPDIAPPEKIWLSPPHLSGKELDYVQQAFAANWVTTAGHNLDAFEAELCRVTGAGFAVALNSGTAAIHLGLILLGIQAHDEVLCPTFTFAATANPILYQHAKPVFIDSETRTWNLCPALARQALTDRLQHGNKPKALIAVHLYGQPAQMPELAVLAAEFDIPLLEDAAEALGSRFPEADFEKKIRVLSFNGNKIITTSGGGALLTDDETLARKALYLATQAREPFPHYQHSEVGYNYRMSNISAGIGRGQLEMLAERIEQKRQIFGFYQQAFAGMPEISFQPEPAGYFSNRWLTAILIDPQSGTTPEKIRLALAAENIESRPLWKPLHLQPVFESFPFYTKDRVADALFAQGLCLPSGTQLTDSQLNRIVKVVKSCL